MTRLSSGRDVRFFPYERSSSSKKAAVEGRSFERSSSSYEYERNGREECVHVCCVRLVGWFFFVGVLHIILSIIGTDRPRERLIRRSYRAGRRRVWWCYKGSAAIHVAAAAPVSSPLSLLSLPPSWKGGGGRQSDRRKKRCFHEMYVYATTTLLASRSNCRHAVSPFHLLSISPSLTHTPLLQPQKTGHAKNDYF